MLLLWLASFGQLYVSAFGCSLPLATMAPRFHLVLMGTVVNHYTRAGGLIDTQFKVFCVMRGDSGRVHEDVFILANQTDFPCTDDTTPMKLQLSYIVGVSRLNDRNFTFSSEATTERVVFPFRTQSVNKLKQYCEFQRPKPPLENPAVTGNWRCPSITESERRHCVQSSATRAGWQLLLLVLSFLAACVGCADRVNLCFP